jgi:hypothetical protein
MIKDPEKAVIREFFAGVLDEVHATERQTLIIKYKHKPALNDKEILKRKEDERFCQVCFRYDMHDYECKKGGWNF